MFKGKEKRRPLYSVAATLTVFALVLVTVVLPIFSFSDDGIIPDDPAIAESADDQDQLAGPQEAPPADTPIEGVNDAPQDAPGVEADEDAQIAEEEALAAAAEDANISAAKEAPKQRAAISPLALEDNVFGGGAYTIDVTMSDKNGNLIDPASPGYQPPSDGKVVIRFRMDPTTVVSSEKPILYKDYLADQAALTDSDKDEKAS